VLYPLAPVADEVHLPARRGNDHHEHERAHEEVRHAGTHGEGWPADRVNGENTKAAAATTTTSGEAVKDEGGGGGEYSITLNGNCNVVTDVNLAERYRQIHLRNNPDYPQFIVGKDIAILRVDVATARICNISDEVIKWNVGESLFVAPSNGAGMTASASQHQQQQQQQ